MKQYNHQAIRTVHPEAGLIKYSHEGKIYKIYDAENNIISIDEAKVSKEHDRRIAEYDAQEYARNRKVEYDALNQFELQFDDKANDTTTWDDAIEAIKAKYPKP
jgi:hypothetical protein